MVISELVLNGILHLFALESACHAPSGRDRARRIVGTYLTDSLKIVDPEQYIGLFDGFLAFYDPAPEPEDLISRTADICGRLKGHIPRQAQYTILLRFLELARAFDTGESDMLADLSHAAGETFGIETGVISDMIAFLYHPRDHGHLNKRLLIIRPEPAPAGLCCNWLSRPHFSGGVTVLYIEDINTLFLTPHDDARVTLNGLPVLPNAVCLFPPGGILRDARSDTLYYPDILQAVSPRGQKDPGLIFTARNADFRFEASDNGLHDFSFTARGGEMIGVMGGSGVGKSTLVNILNGTMAPQKGKILINGLDLYREKQALEGVIGFVPQDDLLFDELTVYENLYHSSRLCLADLAPADLSRRVEGLLDELNQLETRDLKVGSPLEKTISGGQRKRLNIALELIREPSVLFVDEPTSGLSSADSLNVISLLKEQSLKGKLIIVIIHQPSSDIFKMFDQLWLLDKGGRPIYTGNPIDALIYFRNAVWQAGTEECLCPQCGNVNPEQLFDIIEMKQMDEQGYATSQRRFSPEDWHARHLSARQTEEETPPAKSPPPPARALKRPGLFGQFSIFFTRNLLTRLANRQYLAITLLEAPLLAWIIASISRYAPATGYQFADNHNIPVYFFMSVIVALFMGLSVSAEEIIRDRKILNRERFLHLSWFSYINAKAVYLGLVSAVQTGLYVLVGNTVLAVPDFTLATWLTLFSCSVCASLIGLTISASFRTVVTIYIMIPLLLVPQIILGGMVVPFDDLINRDVGHNRVPVIGNLMPSRWGFEAVMTQQFTRNPFQRPFNALDRQINRADYMMNYYIPELQSQMDLPFLAARGAVDPDQKTRALALVKQEFTRLATEEGVCPLPAPGCL
jgi:ABC-type multidrug transport system ATPase subunit